MSIFFKHAHPTEVNNEIKSAQLKLKMSYLRDIGFFSLFYFLLLLLQFLFNQNFHVEMEAFLLIRLRHIHDIQAFLIIIMFFYIFGFFFANWSSGVILQSSPKRHSGCELRRGKMTPIWH